jgi:hypothetical protein
MTNEQVLFHVQISLNRWNRTEQTKAKAQIAKNNSFDNIQLSILCVNELGKELEVSTLTPISYLNEVAESGDMGSFDTHITSTLNAMYQIGELQKYGPFALSVHSGDDSEGG